jgi:hypothetical protein
MEDPEFPNSVGVVDPGGTDFISIMSSQSEYSKEKPTVSYTLYYITDSQYCNVSTLDVDHRLSHLYHIWQGT